MVVDVDVGGIAELVAAVTSPTAMGADTLRVVLRRTKSGNDHDMRIRITVCGEVIDDELELVDQNFTQHQVLGPHVLLIVGQEVPEPKMLGDRGVELSGSRE